MNIHDGQTEDRNRRAFRYSLIGLGVPFSLVIFFFLLRAGVFRFHDDFYGFQGLAFALEVLLGHVLVGGAVSMRALWLNRASWWARSAGIVNGGLFAFMVWLFTDVAF